MYLRFRDWGAGYFLLKPTIAKTRRQQLIQVVFCSAIFIPCYFRIQFFRNDSLRVAQLIAVQKPIVADFKVPFADDDFLEMSARYRSLNWPSDACRIGSAIQKVARQFASTDSHCRHWRRESLSHVRSVT